MVPLATDVLEEAKNVELAIGSRLLEHRVNRNVGPGASDPSTAVDNDGTSRDLRGPSVLLITRLLSPSSFNLTRHRPCAQTPLSPSWPSFTPLNTSITTLAIVEDVSSHRFADEGQDC